MGGESGRRDRAERRPLGRPRTEAWGGASPGRAGGRAGSAAARGIRLTQLAPAPRNPERRGGEGGERARARVRSGAGRSGGPGSGQEGCERAANPAGGGWRARAHHGGKTRDQVREVGPCCGARAVARGGCGDDLQTRTPGAKPGGRTPGSLEGSGPGPQA